VGFGGNIGGNVASGDVVDYIMSGDPVTFNNIFGYLTNHLIAVAPAEKIDRRF
jgi:hypothetical protein